MKIAHDRIPGHRPHHEDLSMRKGDKSKGPENQGEAQGDHGIDAALGDPVYQLFEEQIAFSFLRRPWQENPPSPF
jgi:hypothetical protein